MENTELSLAQLHQTPHAMKTRTYRGHTILPCSYQSSRKAGYRWYLESVHLPSGIPWGEDCSRRFRSLRAAKEAIRESLAS